MRARAWRERGRGGGAPSPGAASSGRGAASPGVPSLASLPTGYFASYGALLPSLPQPRAPWAAPNAAGVPSLASLPTGYFASYGALLPSLPQPRAPWAAPNAAGVLGPRPPPPHQAYPVAAEASSSESSWDQYNQLYAALQNLSIQQQQACGAPDWFLDTGATSHIPGPSNGENNSEIQ
ncbi:translation initiation factor IF-2-like [Triticum dicoccoides]|uniref:translation initiation factor IF-2-like n=1 Tax=Triticum dicoccoides TaxID=85692 RepID=UPI00188E025C|nr:translation initiation factor IF-2-like [Triticum dicoccoides]